MKRTYSSPACAERDGVVKGTNAIPSGSSESGLQTDAFGSIGFGL